MDIELVSIDLAGVDLAGADVDLAIELEKRGKQAPLTSEARVGLIAKEHALGHFGRKAIFDKLFLERGYWWPNCVRTLSVRDRRV